MNLPPPSFRPLRIIDTSLLPPPPPMGAYNDVPPYGMGPEQRFSDFFGPYITDTGDSTN